jgi:hypothetical protein
MAETAWGTASIAEEVTIKQSANGKSFATHVQLLEIDGAEPMIRFAYSTDGTARRGPVTLRAPDLVKLKKALEKAPRLREALTRAL